MKIAIVNDSLMAIEAIRRALLSEARHHLLWVAKNGAEAVDLCAQTRPELILMDMIMPVMDGVEATRQIMARTPCPILIVTASVGQNSSKVFEALGAGALDAVKTPVLNQPSSAALLRKIDIIGKLVGNTRSESSVAPIAHLAPASGSCRRLVAIGASAGGPAALAKILNRLPRDFPAAVVVVQHVDAQFAAGLAEWLGNQCVLPVRLAREGDNPQAGSVLVAGAHEHLIITKTSALGYSSQPTQFAYRPSVDVFFNSVCQQWQGEVIAVLLTGMGQDGAQGLKALRQSGAHTIAQDQATSAVFGMPKAAAQLNAAVQVLPLDQICDVILARFSASPSAQPATTKISA